MQVKSTPTTRRVDVEPQETSVAVDVGGVEGRDDVAESHVLCDVEVVAGLQKGGRVVVDIAQTHLDSGRAVATGAVVVCCHQLENHSNRPVCELSPFYRLLIPNTGGHRHVVNSVLSSFDP